MFHTIHNIKAAINKDDELKLAFDTNNILIQDNLATFHKYVVKVLYKVNFGASITKDGSQYMDAIIYSFIKTCAQEFPQILNSVAYPQFFHDILDKILPNDLAKHAKLEVDKSLKKYDE